MQQPGRCDAGKATSKRRVRGVRKRLSSATSGERRFPVLSAAEILRKMIERAAGLRPAAARRVGFSGGGGVCFLVGVGGAAAHMSSPQGNIYPW